MQLMSCSVGSACNPDSNEVGNRGLTTNGSLEFTADTMYCEKSTADCSGTLGYGYALHNDTTSENLKICVFNDDGAGSEPEDATQVGNCGTLTEDENMTWGKTTAKLTGSVTSGTAYWICVVTDASTWYMRWNTTNAGTLYFNAIASSYTTPTTNAGDAWSTTTRDLGVYVEIE